MKRKSILILTIAMIAITIAWYWWFSFVEFTPMIFNDDDYTIIKVDKSFHKNLETVLDYYDVTYKVDRSGRLFINRSTAHDKESIHNYTVKALDSNWLSKHGTP
jgi:hypothetical protein